MNPKDLAKAMKRLGIQQEELEAHEVIIRLPDKDLVFSDPQVTKVNAMGQLSFQVTGEPEERLREPVVSEEDVKTVMEQAKVDREKAMAAIKEHKGDLAGAILELTKV
ncbi:MAG: nascent polypeptide-associated complex protein [Candidatus Woesearchaeota archaeon]